MQPGSGNDLPMSHSLIAYAIELDRRTDIAARSRRLFGEAPFMMRACGKSPESFRKTSQSRETEKPFILLRPEEKCLKLEDDTHATEFLLRAYMPEGKKIFKEDWKYFRWLPRHVNLKQK